MKKKYKAVLARVDRTNFLVSDSSMGATTSSRLAYFLPATPEAYEAQVEAMGVSIALGIYAKPGMWQKLMESTRENWRRTVRAQLAAIGITRPKKGTK